MGTRFVVNGFNKLSLEEQDEILNFVNNLTSTWKIEELED